MKVPRIVGVAMFLFGANLVNAQPILTEQEAIQLALKNSGLISASDLQIVQSRQLQKTAWNLPSLDVIAESPTGTFYPVGFLQTMDFPTVYLKQSQLQKQQTVLSEKGAAVTQQEVKRLIHQLYISLQYLAHLQDQMRAQDSAYFQISTSAARQFEAGQIDHLAKTFAASQYGEVHNQYLQVQTDYQVALFQLRSYTGLSDSFRTSPMSRAVPDMDVNTGLDLSSADFYALNPTYQYTQQLKEVSIKSLAVQHNKAIPGLVIGYLNQGPRETETYYKFRIGFRIPIWFGQHLGGIQAARTDVAIAEQRLKAEKQNLSAEMQQAIGNFQKFNASLTYYESTGLQQANEILNSGKRFYESGKTDVINFLRNSNEAYMIKLRYLETLRNFNLSIISINYLTGKL